MSEHVLRYFVLALGALLAACGPSPEPQSRQTELAPAVRARVEGGLTDTILLDPRLLATKGGRTAVYDYGRHAVEVFDSIGRLEWIFGAQGDGPGEFRLPIGLTVGESGDVWVLDQRSRRLSHLTPDGQLESERNLADSIESAEGLTLLADGRLLLRRDEEPALVVLDQYGRVLETLPHPWTRWAGFHPLSVGYRIVTGADGLLATALFFGGGFGIGKLGERFDELYPYVEDLPLPGVRIYRSGAARVEEVDATAIGVRGAALLEDELLILFEGRTDQRRRIIDRYRVADGSYNGTWLLSAPAKLMAAADGFVVTVEGDTIPSLIIRRLGDG
jgi:hypothetical protein